MASTKSNFKGFVFTLDALFAIIVAVAGVSILLYAHFSSTLLYTSPSAEASSVLQNLLQTSVLTASSGSIYARYLLNSWNGNAYSWPQLAHDQYHSSNTSYGLQAPYLLYSFSAVSTITTAAVVDHGIAAFAAGQFLYAINATNGNVVNAYPITAPAPISIAPVIYKNEIIYATSVGNIYAVSTSNAVTQLWVDLGAAATTPLEIENNYLVFGSGSNVVLLNPTNGTFVSAVTLPVSSQAQPPAYANGEYIVSTTASGQQNYIYSYVLAGSTLTNMWSYPLTTLQTTPPIVNGSAIAVGSGSSLYTLTLGGNLIMANSRPNAQIVGIASSPNNFYVETTNAIYAFASSGSTIFSYPTQTDNQNSIPSVSSQMLYTLVGGTNFQGYNTQTGLNAWNVSLPSASSYFGFSNVALAYGNAYVPNGKTMYVFGTYQAQPGDSLLQTLAGMYINNQSTYANLMLNKIYNSSNLGIMIPGNTMGVANFNGQSSYISTGTTGLPLGNSPRSVFGWVYLTGTPSGNWYAVQVYGTGVSGELSGLYVYNDYVYFGGNGDDFGSSFAVPTNTWHFVGYTYNGGTSMTIYYDGQSQTSSISNPLNTILPGSDPSNIGMKANSFSNYFSGSIADVQLYNTALPPSQAMQLYQAGMYGVPTNMTNLIGWWPLNGNPNDYSGYFNLGAPTNVVYQNTGMMPASFKNSFQVGAATVPLSVTLNGVIRSYNVSVISWR
jgi:hypothetical protein